MVVHVPVRSIVMPDTTNVHEGCAADTAGIMAQKSRTRVKREARGLSPRAETGSAMREGRRCALVTGTQARYFRSALRS
jgi:hypothetical protein